MVDNEDPAVSGRTRTYSTDLLVSSPPGDLRARLRQASDRAAFLAHASRSILGTMQTERAVDLTLELLVTGVVDWAQIILSEGPALRCRALAAGGRVVHATLPDARGTGTTLERVMRHGVSDLSLVEPSREGHDGVLESAVPAPALRESLAELRPVDLLVIPLSARGRSYGTLSLARRRGEGFDADAVEFLEDLAQQLGTTIDATRILSDSRRVAGVLGRDLAPPNLPDRPGTRLAAYHRVAYEHEALGGDFYDVHGSDEDWTAVVGDVCGKGVEAAVLTGKVRQTIRTAALIDRDPARVLDLSNRVLVHEGDGTFVTAVCARFRREGERLQVELASAGHPEPYVLRSNGDLHQVEVRGTVLGLFEDNHYTPMTITLEPGDTCLLFTDGVPEAPGMEERFGEERLHRTLAGAPRTDVSAIIETVALALTDHLGDRPHDDIAILGVQNSGQDQ